MVPAKRYIVTKSHEPTGQYREGLRPLRFEPEEDITPEIDNVVIKRRWLLPDEVDEVESRAHIVAVEEDVEDYALPTKSFTLSDDPPPDFFDQTALEYHEIVEAYRGGHRGQGVIVGVADTGIKQETGVRLVLSPEDMKSFIPNEAVNDQNGHGDFCCVAARPYDAKLKVAKVLSNQGSGSRSGIISGIAWLADQGAQVISLSLGGSGTSAAYDELFRGLQAKGVTVFAAAGNGGREGEPVNAPGNSPFVNCVAAVNHRGGGAVADFSCKGPEVDFAGAGVNIQYAGRNWSGTSMATPLVARVFATILGKAKDAAVALKAMQKTCEDTLAPPTHEGLGIPRAFDAIEALPREEPPTPPPPTPPPPPEKPPEEVKVGVFDLVPFAQLAREDFVFVMRPEKK